MVKPVNVALLSDKNTYLKLQEISPDNIRWQHSDTICDFYFHLFCSRPKLDAIVMECQFPDQDFHKLQYCIESNRLSQNLYMITSEVPIETQSRWKHYPASDKSMAELTEDITRLGTHTETASSSIQDYTTTTEQDLQWLQTNYETLLHEAGEAILGLDKDGNITFANATTSELLEVPIEQLLYRNFSEFSPDSPLKYGSDSSTFTDNNRKPRRVGRGIVHKANGQPVYVEYTQSFVGNQKTNTVSIMVMEDITNRLKFESKLLRMAHTDALTGLSNRYYFEKIIRKELNNRRNETHCFVVAMVDLDDFKKINDRYGHVTGDKLLSMVAKRLKDSIRSGDMVARLGGDEFGLLLRNTSMDAAETIAHKIVHRISQPYTIEELTISVSASIGLTLAQGDSLDYETLVNKADTAMYTIKKSGKNGFYSTV